TFLDLLQRPKLLADAKAEFDRRVGAEPMPPLLAENFAAPIDLPWPDYTWNGAWGWCVGRELLMWSSRTMCRSVPVDFHHWPGRTVASMVLSARWVTSRRACLVCFEAIIAMMPRVFDQPLNDAEARLRMSWASMPRTIIHK